jgi:hypothetical protein
VAEVKDYMKRVGVLDSGFTPVAKLADLKATEVAKEVKAKAPVAEEMSVTEVTE